MAALFERGAAKLAGRFPDLEAELAALKPSLIILLGSVAARHFLPDLKGGIFEHAGKVVYDKARDCNFLVGFAPGSIFFDPEKQEPLNAVFAQAAEMLE